MFTIGMAGVVFGYLCVFLFCILRAVYQSKKKDIAQLRAYVRSFKNKDAKLEWKKNKELEKARDKKLKVTISVIAENLIKLDMLSASDPRCCLFICQPGQLEFKFYGQTETIDNNHNPIWKEKFVLHELPETQLSFRVYDDDDKETVEADQMCSMVTTLGDLVDHPGQSWSLRNMHNSKRDKMLVKKKSAMMARCEVEKAPDATTFDPANPVNPLLFTKQDGASKDSSKAEQGVLKVTDLEDTPLPELDISSKVEAPAVTVPKPKVSSLGRRSAGNGNRPSR
mmetsp:Transcript_1213/g.2296  ORF Transcript_1213/g.2296 Transcript_1213/m.2296 type:complete len:282 (+) Transcript_1213:2-847(+)